MSRVPATRRRHIAIAIAFAAMALSGPYGLVLAQSSVPAASDACTLLTDAEVLEATGAAAIARTEPVSTLSVAGYGAGCTRELVPVGGLPAGATVTLDYGFQAPGGRMLFDGQRAVMSTAPRLGGLGDDAYEGLSGELYAVRDDATIALQLLAIGVFDGGLHRTDPAGRALTWRAMSRLPGGAPADATGPLCLFGPTELGELVGQPFETADAGDLDCLYVGGPAPGAYALDIRLEDPPPGTTDATLDVVELGSGEPATVGGRPAWTSDEALWVDLGTRLLVVQPMWLPADPSRPLGDVLAGVAGAAIERLPGELANPTPAPTPMSDTDLGSLFPTELKGAPVSVQTLAGQDLVAQLGGPDGMGPIDTVLAAQGRTVDDLSIGVADLFDANDRSGSIIAVRLRDTDAAAVGLPLLLALQGASDLEVGQTPATVAGKDVLVLDIPGRDPGVPIYAWSHGDVAWFIEAETCVRYTPEQGCEASEVDRPLLEEILGKLP